MNDIPPYLFAIVGDLSDAAAILSEDHEVLHCNRRFEEILGVPMDSGSRRAVLTRLNLANAVRRGGRPQTLALAGDSPPVSVYVYLLDISRPAKKHYLVLVKPAPRKTADARGAIGDQSGGAEKLGAEFSGLVGINPQFRKALLAAQRASKSDISVLIIGESGTGKEILARAIHEASGRKNKPLVDVNCAAMPDALIESELFGYEKGAFTGAQAQGRKGYFDEADEGTILLDEIGDSSPAVQSKLLRVLESGHFKRVGGTKNIRVDVRIISATNQDLSVLIDQKKFRSDLFFRLNPFTIYLPALRERPEDIRLLADHFLKIQGAVQKKQWRFSPECLQILTDYVWPGNVRELKGVVSYAVNMSHASVILPPSLPNFLFSDASESPAPLSASGDTGNLMHAVRELEKSLIAAALDNAPNKSEAIKVLGISRRTFYLKLKEYGLE
ncbi:MAG: sigma 54-interacting transcriptional regulator [Smithellaceae bacterium]